MVSSYGDPMVMLWLSFGLISFRGLLLYPPHFTKDDAKVQNIFGICK
jgi:hypothetical protein